MAIRNLTLSFATITLLFSVNALAGPREAAKRVQRSKVDTRREARADTNNNDVVGPKEQAAARGKHYLKNNSDVDKKWEARADKNNDGTINAAELKEAHKQIWKHHHKVNDPAEKKYDADNNGYLSPTETKSLIQARLRLVHTHGRAKVNTSVEKQFDANKESMQSGS